VSPFERVWALVRKIPRGKVATYGQLSEMIDGRLTPVGVGWAIRAAKEGTIPWQRVVNVRGGISTDKEHPGLQRAMLEAEGVRFGADGRIDLARYGTFTRGAKTSAGKRGSRRPARRR
jgi:methylated-DNA-protein-cysteine methyltransferase related protein